MTPQLMISQLRLGSTGAEILQILEAITGGDQEQQEPKVAFMYNNTPILESIDF